jgi:hypothetical protein
LIYQKFDTRQLADALPKLVHVPELPGRVDVQQRERQGRRLERFLCKVQHHCTVFAHRVEHDRVVAFGDDLANDVNALGLETLQVRENLRFGR